jgi:hypothetical protein
MDCLDDFAESLALIPDPTARKFVLFPTVNLKSKDPNLRISSIGWFYRCLRTFHVSS